mmetsp:Transcript_69188/g.156912  ORF Transcript_69188/g.156912 Transcript_69188/m.156912 type:complete len:308 (+) Transcript_69188:281-1204(+)
MILDVFGVALFHRKSLARSHVTQAFDEVFRCFALLGEDHPVDALGHLLVDLHGGGRLERWVPTEQLKGEDAERPPVNCMRVALGCDQLRSEVVRRAAGGVRLPDDYLCQAHVGELHLPKFIEKEVLWFQVAEYDLSTVQMLESEGCARDVELGTFLLAPQAFLVVSCVQFAAKGQLEEEVQGLLAIVGLVELDDKRAVTQQLHVLLAHDTLLHAGFDNVALAEGLESVGLTGLQVFHHLNGAKSTAAEKTQALEILPGDDAETLRRLRLDGDDLLDGCCSGFAAGIDVRQWPNQHVEAHLVQRQSAR